ncbi:uncharacterized protein A4U43_C07F18380 [Asparagus officinalis]|uniref:Uncharacterized protein n=1 Tax=Asparagus officinalis TaxID=4686 RepID=A0A5P1ECX2_ASPOF|nr:uncharacterized protein A4U43_C07F18380 [Asparagus officinalis]
MGRAPCCDKSKVKKGPWSPEEDTKLKEFIEKNGTGGLKRCGKSCRLRWLNYLRPNIKHGDFSEDEDRIICTLFATIGSRWSIIAAQLPGRTDNDIKNYWNTKLKKKLLGIPASQRKSNQQIKQQQQQQQQFVFSSSTNKNIANSSSLTSHHLFDAHDLSHQYQTEDQRSNLLVFGGQDQSSSSSDGLEESGFENNYIYGGFDGMNNPLLCNQEPSWIDLGGNYGEIKHAISLNDGYTSLLQEPSSANISFKTQERDMYSHNFNIHWS